MEDYNIETGMKEALPSNEMPEEVCACVDEKGSEVVAAALSGGSIYQFYSDFAGDSNFLSRLLPIRGHKLAMALCKEERVYLFSIWNNSLYYTCETRPGSNQFEAERKVTLPHDLCDRVIEKVIVKGLEDGIAVGLILKRSNGTYDFAFSFWEDGESEFTVQFFNKLSKFFFFTGDAYDNLAIVSIGEIYVRLLVSTQEVDAFLVHNPGEVLDVQGTTWEDGEDVFCVLLREGTQTWLAEVKVDEENRSISFAKLISQVGLTRFSLSPCHMEKITEVHIVALGDGTLYHAIMYKKTGESQVNCDQFIPIAGSVKSASCISNTTRRMSIYIIKEGERRIHQRRYNRLTREYMESFMYLPLLSRDGVRKNKCYSSEITLTDQYGAPIPNQYITIRAGDTTYLEIPSGQRRLGRDSVLYLKTDLMGKITVRQQVESLNANPLYIFIPDLMEKGKIIVLNQMQCIQCELENLTVDQLKNAKVSDGYLLPEDVRKSDVKIKELLDPIKEALSRLPGAGSPSAAGACLVSENELNSMHLLEEANQEEAEDLELLDSGSEDLCWGVRDDIISIQDAQVSQGALVLKVIMDGITKTYRFIARSLSQIFDFVEMVFKKIKRSFSKLFEWLGFVFDWKDILRCKRAIRYAFTKQTKYLAKNAVLWQSTFSSQIGEVKAKTDQTLKGLADLLQGASFLNYAKAQEVEDPRIMNAVSNNFLQDKFQKEIIQGKFTIQQDLMGSLPIEAADGFMKLLEQWTEKMGASPECRKVTAYTSEAYTSTASFYTNPMSVLINLLNQLIQLLLSGAETLVRASLELLGTMVAGFEKMADTVIELPFISTLYRSISGGQNLSILDLVALLIAVPVTVCYKLLHSAPPFANEGELTAFCLELDARLGLNNGKVSSGAQICVSEVMKLIGTFGGSMFFCFSAMLDSTNSGELGALETLKKGLSITALVMEFVWTVAYLPCLVGTTGWLAWLIFIWGAVGFSVDTTFYCTKDKHIDWDEKYGIYFTAFYGIIHFILALSLIVSQISEIRGYEIVNAIIPCFSESFKWLLGARMIPGASLVVAFLDVAAMIGIFITGLMDIVKNIEDDLNLKNGGIRYGDTQKCFI